jgi:hypothetical protein
MCGLHKIGATPKQQALARFIFLNTSKLISLAFSILLAKIYDAI